MRLNSTAAKINTCDDVDDNHVDEVLLDCSNITPRITKQ